MIQSDTDRFFSFMNWVVKNKDFEDFWPIGLESTGPRYWGRLVDDLQDVLKKRNKFEDPDYPTSYLALSFCLIYGLRELDFSPAASRYFLDNIFASAKHIKYGDLFNSDGRNIIWSDNKTKQIISLGHSLFARGITGDEINSFSGAILALAESEYFMNHRIATEKHGPYHLSDGFDYLVRSFKNIRPVELWPELYSYDLINEECHLVFKYKECNSQFDMFSNLKTELPNNDLLIDVLVVSENNFYSSITKKEFSEYTNLLHSSIMEIHRALDLMSKAEKSERMTQILYYGCRSNFADWKDLSKDAIENAKSYIIRHPVPKSGISRLHYYDLMKAYY